MKNQTTSIDNIPLLLSSNHSNLSNTPSFLFILGFTILATYWSLEMMIDAGLQDIDLDSSSEQDFSNNLEW